MQKDFSVPQNRRTTLPVDSWRISRGCGCEDSSLMEVCSCETSGKRQKPKWQKKALKPLLYRRNIFYEFEARHIAMTLCCLLYALPIYLESPDSDLWLYSCKGISFNRRPSIQSARISAFTNTICWFDSLQAAFEVIGIPPNVADSTLFFCDFKSISIIFGLLL